MILIDRYIFKNLMIATIFVTITLTSVIFLTQSLRFLELVLESGASATAFWLLTILALPRFFEVILPISLTAAIIFIYNKLIADSELVVMRASGLTPMALARPALLMAGIVTLFLWIMTMWVGPSSLAHMQEMRQMIKAQYSTLLFREGVFNPVSDGLTVFIREKDGIQNLQGIMIHDTRPETDVPVTITAKRGVISMSRSGQQVIVHDGIRQSVNPQTGVLERLDFERYTIDLPDPDNNITQRWQEPDERTIFELMNPDLEDERDLQNLRDLRVEVHRRIVSPAMAACFTVIALCAMLLGPISRRGQGLRIVSVIGATITIQGLYLGAFNLSLQNDMGLVLMYILAFVPMGAGLFVLSPAGEATRHRLMRPRLKHKKASS
jgi:lipopolysaccharide export system permease protein